MLWQNTMSKTWRRKVSVPILHKRSSFKTVRAGTHTGKEPGGRSCCRGHGGMLLMVLFLVACSACFLLEFRATSPGMAPLSVGQAFLHQPIIKKIHYSQILWRHFLNWGFCLIILDVSNWHKTSQSDGKSSLSLKCDSLQQGHSSSALAMLTISRRWHCIGRSDMMAIFCPSE